MLDRNLIIVGGCPRSGTTLLRLLLGAHPAVHSLPELKCFGLLAAHAVSMWEQFGRHLAAHAGVDERDVMQAYGQALLRLLRPAWEQHSVIRLCEKTPVNVFVFPQLAQMLPGAWLVEIVRDPYDVVASLLRQTWKDLGTGERAVYTQSAKAAAELWVMAGRCAAGADRYRVVYEQLCRDPEGQLSRLCRHLGIEYDPVMLTRYRELARELPADEQLSHAGRLEQPIDRAAIGRGNELTAEQRAEVDAVLAEHGAEL